MIVMNEEATQPAAPPLARRSLFAGTGALTVSALAAAGMATKAFAAEQPAVDSGFKDFTLPQFQCDDSLVRVQKKGELVLTTSNDWPYSYLDSKTNAFTGIDADIITFCAKMLRIPRINVKTVAFDGMIPGLLDGRFDIVGDSIHYTKARAKVVDFSFPTYYYSEWLVVKKGNPLHVQSLADLKGRTCGALLGTNYAEWIQAAPGVNYKAYKDWVAMAHDIMNGRLDAALHDQPIAAATIKDHPEWDIGLATQYQPHQLKNPVGYSRYAFRQADVQLRTGFSAAIEWMEDSGELSRILDKWGLSGYNN